MFLLHFVGLVYFSASIAQWNRCLSTYQLHVCMNDLQMNFGTIFFVSSFASHQRVQTTSKCYYRGHVDPKIYFSLHNRIMFTVVGIFCSSDIGWFRDWLFLMLIVSLLDSYQANNHKRCHTRCTSCCASII